MSGTPEIRQQVAAARRIVVKVGTRLLVDASGRPDLDRIQALSTDLAALCADREVVLVSSGAIGAGIEALDRSSRPTTLPELQMAAAIGQTRLLSVYDRLFAERGIRIGQVLLTRADLNHRGRHLNARNTLSCLLKNGILPVVNENDAVSVDEIKLGDNDVLAALVTILIDADLLVLLTTVDGFQDGQGQRVPAIAELSPELQAMARGPEDGLSTGGMNTKLEAAGQVSRIGALAVIADGREPGMLQRILAGEDTGTLVHSSEDHDPLTRKRKHWLAFFHKPEGVLVVDTGAVNALRQKGTSLLPVGIKDVQGSFPKGALLQVRGPDGSLVAQGLSDYSSEDLLRIKGLNSTEIGDLLGANDYDEAIHRDNLVLL